MIDPKSFYKANPYRELGFSSDFKIFRGEENEHNNLGDNEFAICSPQIPGFCLKSKRWGYFKVENISKIKFDTGVFDKLILPTSQKEVLYSLVNAHVTGRASFDDIIPGKGKGMVFLLHGSVGAGKTVTAGKCAWGINSSKTRLLTSARKSCGAYAAAFVCCKLCRPRYRFSRC